MNSLYSGLENNPIANYDRWGDIIIYSSAEVQKLVEKYTNETITKKGKVKENPSYNKAFADLIAVLAADQNNTFNFTEDGSLLKSTDPTTLGEITAGNDGKTINVVVPDWSGTTREESQRRNGGRSFALFEEVFHAKQFLDGDITNVQSGNTYSLSISSKTTSALVEADAKIFAADNAPIISTFNVNWSNSNYDVSTWANLIRGTKNEPDRRKAVAQMLVLGTVKSYPPKDNLNAQYLDYPHKPPYKTY